jgi:hypothetical protein
LNTAEKARAMSQSERPERALVLAFCFPERTDNGGKKGG